jgi:ATP-dependent Clp protease ATP-binding subunit ClpC
MYPFERFNEDAKRTLTLAQEEAERSHHSYIGTEHLLLALLRVETGTAYRVLINLGVAIDPVREAIKSVLGRNERIFIRTIIPTSRVKQVIEISFGEARRMGHNFVDTGHLLMGLIIEGEGIAAHVLQDMGATLEKVVPAVERELGAPTSARLKGRGRRPLIRFPGRPHLGPPTGRIEIVPTHASEATDLLRLLRAPAIARLLKARGIDTDALSKQLTEQPAKVAELRSKLAVANHALKAAVDSQDYEVAAKLRDEVKSLAKKLAKAEQEWLDSLA